MRGCILVSGRVPRRVSAGGNGELRKKRNEGAHADAQVENGVQGGGASSKRLAAKGGEAVPGLNRVTAAQLPLA